MDNNKAFAIYLFVIVGGLLSVLTAAIWAGVTTLPGPIVFAEHVALGLTFRAAYKSLGGPAWCPYPEHAEATAGALVPSVPDGFIGAAQDEEVLDAA